jgi:hypothetical protein
MGDRVRSIACASPEHAATIRDASNCCSARSTSWTRSRAPVQPRLRSPTLRAPAVARSADQGRPRPLPEPVRSRRRCPWTVTLTSPPRRPTRPSPSRSKRCPRSPGAAGAHAARGHCQRGHPSGAHLLRPLGRAPGRPAERRPRADKDRRQSRRGLRARAGGDAPPRRARHRCRAAVAGASSAPARLPRLEPGRPHLAGALGAALAHRLFELGWLQRRPANRSVEVTPRGRVQLREEFGLDFGA